MNNERLTILILSAVMLITVLVTVATGSTIYVPVDHPTIQDAINAAHDGDIILVENGTYTGPNNRDLQWNGSVKHLNIRSVHGPDHCIIDCEALGRGFILDSGQDNTDVIEGLTIRNGKATSVSVPDSRDLHGGGAILCDGTSPVIINCVMEENLAYSSPWGSLADGGAIDVINGGYPIIRHNHIVNNTATHTGGGIHVDNSEAIMEYNVITGNVAMGCYGGGGISCIATRSDSRILGNLIANNTANYYSLGGYGGGILCMNSSVEITSNTIVYNTTWNGSDPGEGGGIRIRGLSLSYEYPVITNNIIWGNESSPGLEDLDFQYTDVLQISYCNVGVGLAAVTCPEPLTNISADPLFVGSDDYRLQTTSPCIDAGINMAWMASAQDLDGSPRIVNGTVDIGAYELDLIAYWPLNEGTGTMAYDVTPNANHGMIHNAGWGTGISGTCLNFNGINDYVNVSHDSDLNLVDGATVEFWFKRAGGFGMAQYILDKRTYCPGDSDFFFYLGMDNRLHGIFVGVSANIVSSSYTIMDDRWHHALFTYDHEYTTLYIDGTFHDQEPITGSIVLAFGDLKIGRAPCGLNFNGSLDEIKIWNRPLSADEAAEQFSIYAPVYILDSPYGSGYGYGYPYYGGYGYSGYGYGYPYYNGYGYSGYGYGYPYYGGYGYNDYGYGYPYFGDYGYSGYGYPFYGYSGYGYGYPYYSDYGDYGGYGIYGLGDFGVSGLGGLGLGGFGLGRLGLSKPGLHGLGGFGIGGIRLQTSGIIGSLVVMGLI